LVILILGLSNKEFEAAPVSFPGKPGITESEVAGPDNLSSDNADTIRTKKKEITVIGYGISKTSPDSSKIRIRSGKTGTQPLFILDGKEIESIEAISPDQIESISVLKDESATTIYGEKGLHGVVLITSKKADKPGSEALIILDGKETTKKVSDINPENIQSVNVLKGESAISEYGEKGKNGVIEITMKHQTDNHIQTIQTVQQLRKHIASSIRYPVKAQEAGQEGSVLIYAFVSDEGKITQITESKPKVDITSVDEVVIVAYAVKSDKRPSGNDLSVLNKEGALCVKNLPDLDIPEYKNKWVAFQFKFVLQ
jgi:TonB-dependent SusC/RagA subfamily outer membrane receptor